MNYAFVAVAIVIELIVYFIYATANAVNLTDGLDGLAAGSSALTFSAFMIIAFTEFRHPLIYGGGNQAFAAQALAVARALRLAPEITNVSGGAIALGHPIGATGARIMTTLLYALRARGKKRGIASLCIGGGEATAIAIELV